MKCGEWAALFTFVFSQKKITNYTQSQSMKDAVKSVFNGYFRVWLGIRKDAREKSIQLEIESLFFVGKISFLANKNDLVIPALCFIQITQFSTTHGVGSY